MTTIADFHRAVQTTLASKQLGTPVFVRYLFHSPLKGPAILPRLAKSLAAVRAWMNQPLDRLYIQGSEANRHITITVEFRTGTTALITWIGTSGRGSGIDLTVAGNHGAIYHDAGDAPLWEEVYVSDDAEADRDLIAWIERALRSGRPEPTA